MMAFDAEVFNAKIIDEEEGKGTLEDMRGHITCFHVCPEIA